MGSKPSKLGADGAPVQATKPWKSHTFALNVSCFVSVFWFRVGWSSPISVGGKVESWT